MSQEQLNVLIQVFNALSGINTKGEDTLVMADCLRAMQQVLTGLQEGSATEENISEEE